MQAHFLRYSWEYSQPKLVMLRIRTSDWASKRCERWCLQCWEWECVVVESMAGVVPIVNSLPGVSLQCPRLAHLLFPFNISPTLSSPAPFLAHFPLLLFDSYNHYFYFSFSHSYSLLPFLIIYLFIRSLFSLLLSPRLAHLLSALYFFRFQRMNFFGWISQFSHQVRQF